MTETHKQREGGGEVRKGGVKGREMRRDGRREKDKVEEW